MQQLFRSDRPLTPSWSFVKPSLDLVKANLTTVGYLAFLPSLVVAMGATMFDYKFIYGEPLPPINSHQVYGLIVLIIGLIWSLLTAPGIVIMQLRAMKGEQPLAMDCFKAGISKFFPWLWMSIMVSVATTLGLLAFVFPGLILVRSLFLSQYYFFDQDLKPDEAIKQSFYGSKPHAGYIWGTISVVIMLSVLGSIISKIYIIGNIISVSIAMVYMFIPALRYMEIKDLPVEEDSVIEASANDNNEDEVKALTKPSSPKTELDKPKPKAKPHKKSAKKKHSKSK